MLSLRNVVKDYVAGDTTVHALKGITTDFRNNEFVSVLGASGCGKTTLLNIIGGLDRYSSGDLFINGVSTKLYTDGDWDVYRNHTIGFIFQTYNLIMHQNVLENVMLALTLSGVSAKERKERAIKALEKVGLGEQIYKKPNQLSGGQMQRVAIARAIVNDPDIILADEPTGALDTATSVQIMDILKEIAKDKLVIMVTHNPALAEEYSTRIISIQDGLIVSDTAPVSEEEFQTLTAQDKLKRESYDREPANQTQAKKDKAAKSNKNNQKRQSMSFKTAFFLSLKNLLTKKARTILVSVAGSIGIIGIALILSLSNGFQVYINKVQEDTLSNYPLTIEKSTVDTSSMLSSVLDSVKKEDREKIENYVYSNDIMMQLMKSVLKNKSQNNLSDFMNAINQKEELKDYISAIKYTYNVEPQIFISKDEPLNVDKKTLKVNPSNLMNTLFGKYLSVGSEFGIDSSYYSSMAAGIGMNINSWAELIDNQTLLSSQYDLIGEGSRWPTNYNEVVIAIDSNEEINDFILYSLGLKSEAEIKQFSDAIKNGTETPKTDYKVSYSDLLSLKFKLILEADYYYLDGGVAKTKTNEQIIDFVENDQSVIELKVTGIIKPKPSAATTSLTGTVGYTPALTQEIVKRSNSNAIISKQRNIPDVDVFTGSSFSETNNLSKNLEKLGYAQLSDPSSISIYAADFESKDKIVAFINEYNEQANKNGKEENVINYTDYVGIMMSSITTIINAISYVLIGFVAISLVVSSIMIGVITYISVFERTKEIGILRSIGASKRDISRVFNAETFIIGLCSGIFGVLAAILLDVPINLILAALASLYGIAAVPWWGALSLVVISVILTLIAGIIPSRIAAKKDPVIALRTE